MPYNLRLYGRYEEGEMADHWRWAYASSRDREQPGAEACGSASSSQWRPQGCVVSGGAAQPTAKGTTSLVLRRPLGAESRPCGQTRRSTGTRVVVPCDAWASSEHVVRCRLSQRGWLAGSSGDTIGCCSSCGTRWDVAAYGSRGPCRNMRPITHLPCTAGVGGINAVSPGRGWVGRDGLS